MPDNPAKLALEELLDYLELVETQSGALMAFLRDNGMVTDEKLKPYLEKAANATDVKSRAIHARFDSLFKSEEAKPSTEAAPEQPKQAGQPAEQQKSQASSADKRTSDAKPGAPSGNPELGRDQDKDKSYGENDKTDEPSEIVSAHMASKDESRKGERTAEAPPSERKPAA